MIAFISHYLERRRLENAQRAAAAELQSIYDQRVAWTLREKYLERRLQQLAVCEVDLNITARRRAM